MNEWHYNESGRQSGPHSTDELRRLLATGAINPATLVWNPAMPNWRPAGDFAELLPIAVPDDTPRPGAPTFPPIPVHGSVHYATPTRRSHNGSAVSALVVALLGLVAPCGATLLAIVAVVIAANALSAMSKSGNSEGRGVAIAAIAVAILVAVSRGLLFAVGSPFQFHLNW